MPARVCQRLPGPATDAHHHVLQHAALFMVNQLVHTAVRATKEDAAVGRPNNLFTQHTQQTVNGIARRKPHWHPGAAPG